MRCRGEDYGQFLKKTLFVESESLFKCFSFICKLVNLQNNPVKFPDRDVDFEHLLKNMIACNTVFVQKGKRRDVIDVSFQKENNVIWQSIQKIDKK